MEFRAETVIATAIAIAIQEATLLRQLGMLGMATTIHRLDELSRLLGTTATTRPSLLAGVSWMTQG
jgi:hypothetical protein